MSNSFVFKPSTTVTTTTPHIPLASSFSAMSSHSQWYHGIPYTDAMYILHWNHYQHLESVLESKGAMQFEIKRMLGGFSVSTKEKYWYKVRNYKGFRLIMPSKGLENIQQDKVLQWLMNNPLPNGQRNNILFRNAASLLILYGIPKEKQFKYADKIMKNYAVSNHSLNPIKYSSKNKNLHRWLQHFHKNPPETVYNNLPQEIWNKIQINQWFKQQGIKGIRYEIRKTSKY